ncbi:hypothetical protein BH09PAT2_BH09PAT2_04430 [soil metagenome]
MNKQKTSQRPDMNVSKDRFAITSYISPLDTIVKSDSEEILGTVLSLISSSHTPIFVFTKTNSFLGLISLQETRYTHSYPYSTKVASVVMTPPHITDKTPLYNVAARMLETHLYTLPVFADDKTLLGVIEGKNMLKNILRDKDLMKIIVATIRSHTPHTISQNATIGEVRSVMKDKRISRVVLLDEEGKLTGIISRQDLLDSSMKPNDKQRFGKNGNPQTDRAFDQEKESRDDESITPYATDRVKKIQFDVGLETIIKELLAGAQGSIVLINTEQKPVGFLSIHDLLTVIASLQPVDSIPLMMSRPSNNVADEDLKKAEEHLERFGQKMNKRMAIEKIEVHFEEPKYQSGGTVLFNISLIVSPIAGSNLIAHTKKAHFLDSIQAATAQIEKQERRSDVTRNESLHTNI